jgi:alpha-glucosidase
VSTPAARHVRHASATEWWRDAAVYEVYVKSYADSDGDGIGDLDGVTARLDHLLALGVDALWLTPCYPSPDRDGGYDVADYVTVADVYGGDAALRRLVAAAHDRGLRVLLDLVPNHCSTQHPWFQDALREPPDGRHRSLFLFRDGRGPDGAVPPNNWRSVFGGPAWTRIAGPGGRPDQWYLHLFDPGQADFDWRNPDVPAYFERVLRHWFDLGVDGFRIDVAHGLLKTPGLPDHDPELGLAMPMLHQADVHDVYRAWRRLADGYLPERELVFVGEAWAPSPTATAEYVRSGELHETFYFDLVTRPWDAAAFRESVRSGLEALDAAGAASDAAGTGVFAWTLNNHDVFRSVSRYGLIERSLPVSSDPKVAAMRPRGVVDVELGRARARAAALFVMALPGPVYLYQGEELGLPEVLDLPDGRRQDPIARFGDGSDLGRDGCRVPLPWSSDRGSFGFSPDDARAEPWLPQPAWFAELTADAQTRDSGSTLTLYRRALALRRQRIIGMPREVEWLAAAGREDVVVYRRGELVVATNFGTEPWALPPAFGSVILRSDDSRGGPVLMDSSTVWLAGDSGDLVPGRRV